MYHKTFSIRNQDASRLLSMVKEATPEVEVIAPESREAIYLLFSAEKGIGKPQHER